MLASGEILPSGHAQTPAKLQWYKRRMLTASDGEERALKKADLEDFRNEFS